LHPIVVLVGTVTVSLVVGLSVARGSLLEWTPVALAIMALYVSVRPDQLFVAWLFIAPFVQESARQTQIGSLLATVVFVLPLLVFALHMAKSNSIARGVRWYDALPLGYLAFIITSQAFVDASRVASPHFYVGLLHSGVLVGVLMYYFCAFGPLERLSAGRMSAALLSSVSIVGALGILQHYAGWTLWGAHLIDSDLQNTEARIAVTLSNPAILGAFLGAGVAMSVSILVWTGPQRLRLLAITTIVVALPALFFTYTRAGVVATVLASAALVAFRPRTRVVAAGFAFAGLILLVANWGSISSSTVYEQRAADSSNVSGRLIQSRAALELTEARPFLGWGYGQYDAAKNTLEVSSGNLPERSLYAYTSHNTFLTILVELGIVGLAVLLLPWTIVAWRTVRTIRSPSGYPQWFTLGLLAILAVVMVTALTTDMRFSAFVPGLAWIAVGLLRRRLWDEASHA
jgi:O-antigen ligase